ncbi:family 43 glycosylhydrolase [Vibrio sp. WXL103]|uniref:family 43 glycosylhydrolase n=1 Tax=Vibrio sp. WXL103 TaxID=3450710 RepID=UPI003EC54115
MNPILPIQRFVPDAEARVWPDGLIYLYGSKDLHKDTWYCSFEYDVFYSDDLLNWSVHEKAFDTSNSHANARLFAPDAMKIGNQYCLFYCMEDNSQGVAFSQSPLGPFRDAIPIRYMDGDSIDPTVLCDDDGKVYLYWGQGNLRGAQLDTNTWKLHQHTLNTELLNETEDGFHEGASIRKIGDVYYMVFADSARGKPTCLSYATADHPLGPFTKQGVIIDNAKCDPSSWNNHGSIQQFDDRWYVFYHRSSEHSKVNRRLCVEPIHIDAEGKIPEVVMSSTGVSDSLPRGKRMQGYRCCEMQGKCFVTLDQSSNEAWLTQLHHGDVATFRYFNLKGCTKARIDYGSLNCSGWLNIVVDGTTVARLQVASTGGWQQWRSTEVEIDVTYIDKLEENCEVSIECEGLNGRIADLNNITFL